MKKAQFFLIDGIISIIILTIGFLLISTSNPKNEQFFPIENTAKNIMDVFAYIKGDELCDNDSCTNNVLENLYLSDTIKNINQTILDILGELYSKREYQEANELFENITITNNLIREDLFGMEFKINNEVIYYFGKNREKSRELISIKKIIFGFYENKETGTVNFWGPYLSEINVWNEK